MRISAESLNEAVTQACREETMGFTSGPFTFDEDAAAHGGGTTSRVACLLGAKVGTVRQRLAKLRVDGKMVRAGRRTSSYRWWPIGLADKIKAGKV